MKTEPIANGYLRLDREEWIRAVEKRRRRSTMSELLRLADVARIVGVSYERARQLRHQPGFPEPVGRRGKGELGRPRTFGVGLGPTTAAIGVGVRS